MTDYKEIIEIAIQKEIEVLGKKKAMSIAESIEGLQVDDQGSVESLGRNGKQVLGDLVNSYQRIGGSVSASLIARELEHIMDEEIDLPEILDKRVRAERFASAI